MRVAAAAAGSNGDGGSADARGEAGSTRGGALGGALGGARVLEMLAGRDM